jgi:hypothetical protein
VKKEEGCAVVTVVGEAGIGKTRLAREFVASAGDEARVVVGRCVAYGAGATYMPIADVVRQAAPQPSQDGIASLLAGEDDAEQVAQRVAEVVGFAEGPAAPGEAFLAVRTLFEVLARERPLIIVFDDLHWAEPTLLDLVEYLGEWAEGAILVVGLARRELLESRPSWGGPTSTGTLVELKPLARDEVTTLVYELAGGLVAPDVQERIVDRAGGNPLFAEQLLALAAEAPEMSIDETPPSVEALIASRLDRLEPRELSVLRRASVLGRLFVRGDLEDLAPVDEADLQSLVRRALIHPIGANDRFRFHHVLVCDVAYRGIPKAERAALHERVANNLDRRVGADEIIGYHLEQAYDYRVEVERKDDRAQALAALAGAHLGRAGIRAWKRADVPATLNLLSRSIRLLPPSDSTRGEILSELAIVLRLCGEANEAEHRLSDAIADGRTHGDERVELRARLELANLRVFSGDQQATTLLDLATSAVPRLEELGDERALGRAWLFVGQIRGSFHGENSVLEDAAERAATHYRRAGFSPSTCLGYLGSALYYGPRRVDDAIAVCDRLLTDHRGDLASEANIIVWQGGLEAMRGNFEQARSLVGGAKRLYEDLGQALGAGDTCGLVLAAVEILAQRLEAAELALRESCDTCRRLHESALLASRAAELADVLYGQGRLDEAAAWNRVSRDLAADEDRDAQASWRAVGALLAAREGKVRFAGELACEAVEIIDQTDALNHRAKALLTYAEVMRMAAQHEHAAKAARRALQIYESKGNIVAAENARSTLESALV